MKNEDDLIERLREVESSSGPGVGGVVTNWYRNPDGPEAADLIGHLRAHLRRLIWECEAECTLDGHWDSTVLISQKTVNAAKRLLGDEK